MQGATRLPRFGRVRPGTRSGAVLAGVLAVLAFGCSGTRAAADPGPASAGGIEEQPLAPRSGPRGKTLFTVIPPEESGVRTENTYDDPEIWGRLSREFDLGAVGTGVAIGDYDNDGLPDIFVVSKTGSCLFRDVLELPVAEIVKEPAAPVIVHVDERRALLPDPGGRAVVADPGLF